ncbi:PIG-L deacetylase family protein [Phenylobacterium sp.]|uniref:PIG-L deacetylase family protein n=1 Tax=Phenylobacterium sp. TaxID=1871053 RepID=UPI002732D04C|nr:PIG-L family deacetylase [Phenylobacterium sp.]MDP3852563.1 PIG-L family deacetylase [Phenylobacterium sp.]
MTVILAIHAHPDDIEILGAGTLGVLAGLGHTVKIATVTAGDLGSAEMDQARTARARQAEAAAAAALVGAEYRCGGIGDLCVFNDDASRRTVTELVRWAGADVVLTASPADYHPDHEAVSLLVRDACFAASVPNYATGSSPPLAWIPHLYFMDPIGGRDRAGAWTVPDFGVDIEATFQTKRAMLAAHQSQAAWVARQHDVPDQLQSMETWSRRRGRDFGVAMAEGFRQYRHHPYPATPLLQELVGAAFVQAPRAAS